jgi:radical SAM protein with 4Fe4S-binding SPASM domain
VPDLQEFADNSNLEINFVPVLNAINDEARFIKEQQLDCDNLKLLEETFNQRVKMPLAYELFWQDHFQIMRGHKRRFPCALLYYMVFMGANGDVYTCSVQDPSVPKTYGNIHEQDINTIWNSKKAEGIRKKMMGSFCPNCTYSCVIQFSLQSEFFYLAKFRLKRFLKNIFRRNKLLSRGG